MATLRLLFLAALLAAQCAPSHAQEQAELETWDTARLFDTGTTMLRYGKALNRAIQRLQIVMQREPKNAEYQSALACAYASRYASVAVARELVKRFDDFSRAYDWSKTHWAEDQKDSRRPFYGLPEPHPPSPPITLDDGQPYKLTDEQSRKELFRLGQSALDRFEKASLLAAKLPIADRIRLDYAKGWGLFLLRRFGDVIVRDIRPEEHEKASAPKTDALVIPPEDVVACFKRCTEAGPKDRKLRDYWFSVALASAPGLASRDVRPDRVDGPKFSDETVATAMKAIERALALPSPHRAALFAAGLLYLGRDPGVAADYLERAAREAPDNAVAWYIAAEALFQYEEKMDEDSRPDEAKKARARALELAARGNQAPRYAALTVEFPAPPMLHSAWAAAKAYGIPDDWLAVNFGARMMYIAREASAKVSAADALPALQLQFDFGAKVLTAMDGADLDLRLPWARYKPKTRRTYGALHCWSAYREIEKINAKQPDPALAAFLAANADLYDRSKKIQEMYYLD